MASPIHNRIGCVFIPVSDVARARAWYAQLLGVTLADASHAGKIVDVPLAGETQLILDGHKPVVNSSQPLFFFWTDDIQATFRFLQHLAIEIVTPIEDIGSVTTLVFRDLDQNLLMVCQRNNLSAQ